MHAMVRYQAESSRFEALSQTDYISLSFMLDQQLSYRYKAYFFHLLKPFWLKIHFLEQNEEKIHFLKYTPVPTYNTIKEATST